MNESPNPYDSPRIESECRMAVGTSAAFRFWCLFGSLALYVAVPWGLHWAHAEERRREIIEISSLGGQLFLTATWSPIVTWFLLLLSRRTATLAVGLLALMSTIGWPLAVNVSLAYQSPTYWSCLAACVVMIAGAVCLPRRRTTPGTEPGCESPNNARSQGASPLGAANREAMLDKMVVPPTLEDPPR